MTGIRTHQIISCANLLKDDPTATRVLQDEEDSPSEAQTYG